MYKLFIFVFIGWNRYKFNFMALPTMTIPMVHHDFVHHDHTYGQPWLCLWMTMIIVVMTMIHRSFAYG
jgi:hypothetical protein